MEQHIIDTKQYIEQLNLLLYCCSVFKANTLINAQSNQVAVLYFFNDYVQFTWRGVVFFHKLPLFEIC